MSTFIIHTKPGCPWCEKAKKAIKDSGESYQEIIYAEPDEIAEFKALGFKTFPQIYQNGEHIGGFADLLDYLDDDF